MKQFNLMKTCPCNAEPKTELTAWLIIQITALMLATGLGTGYTFAELNQFHTNVNQYLHLEPHPLKLPKIRTDVNIKDKYRRVG